MSAPSFDSSRLSKALWQEARRLGFESKESMAILIDKTIALISMCGVFSQNRKMALRIGLSLLHGFNDILCPVCVDYGDLKNWGSNTRRFVELHLAFLDKVRVIVPDLKPTFLIPDQEAVNPELLDIINMSGERLEIVLRDIQDSVSQLIVSSQCRVTRMTSLVEDLGSLERSVLEQILRESSLKSRIEAQTLERWDMYQRMQSGMKLGDMQLRTAQTTAQYIVLGRIASEKKAMICNHSTTSLRWYMETEAAVLHNPITLIAQTRP